MNKPMSAAQQSQQSNRTSDGKYATKSHSESDISLSPKQPPWAKVEAYLHRDEIDLGEFRHLHDVNKAHIQAFTQADHQFWSAYHDNKRRNGRGSYRAFPADNAMYQAHMRRKVAFYQMSLTDVAHAKHAENHGYHRSLMELNSYTHYEQEAARFQQWKDKQNQTRGSEYVHRPNPTMNDDYHYNKAKRFLATFTGRHPKEVDRRTQALMQEHSVDRHQAMQELWATARMRDDKPLVFIDFETACRTFDDIGTVDTGQYSDIIEVGYEKIVSFRRRLHFDASRGAGCAASF